MGGRLYTLLQEEHRALEELLARAASDNEQTAKASYQEFRQIILRHIGIEEKILIPGLQRVRNGEPYQLASRLRLDHGALAALTMLPPQPTTLRAIRAVLDAHNPLEEGKYGLYEECEAALEDDLARVIELCRQAPPVAVSPWSNSERVLAAAKRALVRAGYPASLVD